MTSSAVNRRVPYVRLGSSGLKVSKIILGCMSYGSPEWQDWVLAEEEGIKHIKYAYDNGIQTFDTANVYSAGASEIILGKAIKEHNIPREEIVVMTKLYGLVRKSFTPRFNSVADAEKEGYVNQQGLSRKHIFDSVKKSLERLQLDYIDVLQCHRFDANTPIEETMQALHDVVKAGYCLHIGMSSCWAWQFSAMQNYAINNNLTPFISMQNHYSVLYREEEREMMPTLKHFGVGSIPWSPLARGAAARPLTEKTLRGEKDMWRAEVIYLSEPSGGRDIVPRIEELAKKKGVSMAQISLAWLFSKPGVTAPIIGTTSIEKLDDLIGAVNVTLSEEEVKFLDEKYKPMNVIF